jgi:hypothetical protein
VTRNEALYFLCGAVLTAIPLVIALAYMRVYCA